MTNIIVFVNYTQPENTVISGYAISIMYIGMSLGSILLGPLADKFEPKRILSISFVVTGIGCALMLLFSPITSVLLLAASLGILGFGLGANATIFMRVVLSEIPTKKAGAATGTYGLFRDLAAPFGVAIFVPLFTNRVTAKLIAVHEAKHKIRCNSVLPGMTATDAVKENLSDDFRTLFLKHIPLGRMGLPEEIASAVVYFASDDSAYTTGQILTVSGGFGLATPVYGDLKDRLNRR